MITSPPDPTTVPPPPPFATPTSLEPDEEDVDLEADDDQGDEDQQLAQDTQEEEVEFMGEAESLEAFFRSQMEDLIDPCLHTWIFDCMDMSEVQAQFEGNRYRYIREGRAIYRAGMPIKPGKDKDPAPGPWMPTRGQ